jgi:hypothetical protein
MGAISSKTTAIVKRIAQIVDKLSSEMLSLGNLANDTGATFGVRTPAKSWQFDKSLDSLGLNIKVCCHAAVRLAKRQFSDNECTPKLQASAE